MDGRNLFKGANGTVDSVRINAFVSSTMGRKRHAIRRKRQKGGARFQRKPLSIDKIAEGVAMRLSGPAPNFAKAGAFLAKQEFEGIKDNVQHNRRRGK